MTTKKTDRLRGLYAITGEHRGEQLFRDAELALRAGLKLLQYRNKSGNHAERHAEALRLRRLCERYDAALIINDDVDLAAAVRADGVHLGRDDAGIAEARRTLGEQALIGVSCYNDLQLAHQAEQGGADYVAFGSFFASPTKPAAVRADASLLRAWRDRPLPACAIGGITPANGARLVEAGADMLAVISSLWNSGDVGATTRRFIGLFQQPPD